MMTIQDSLQRILVPLSLQPVDWWNSVKLPFGSCRVKTGANVRLNSFVVLLEDQKTPQRYPEVIEPHTVYRLNYVSSGGEAEFTETTALERPNWASYITRKHTSSGAHVNEATLHQTRPSKHVNTTAQQGTGNIPAGALRIDICVIFTVRPYANGRDRALMLTVYSLIEVDGAATPSRSVIARRLERVSCFIS